jgi:hypothetical protein
MIMRVFSRNMPPNAFLDIEIVFFDDFGRPDRAFLRIKNAKIDDFG